MADLARFYRSRKASHEYEPPRSFTSTMQLAKAGTGDVGHEGSTVVVVLKSLRLLFYTQPIKAGSKAA